MALEGEARESFVRLWAYAYTMGARHMLGVVSGRLQEWATAELMGQGQDTDIRDKLMVDALLLEQQALQFGESMVARLERRGEAKPPPDMAD